MNRREFLKMAGLGSLAVLVAKKFPCPGDPDVNNMIGLTSYDMPALRARWNRHPDLTDGLVGWWTPEGSWELYKPVRKVVWMGTLPTLKKGDHA